MASSVATSRESENSTAIKPTEKQLLANLAPDEGEIYSKSACHSLVDGKKSFLTTCNQDVLEGYEPIICAVPLMATPEGKIFSKSACHSLVDCKINEYLTTCNQESPRRL